MNGNPVTTEGKPLVVGDSMPAFLLTANDLSDFASESASGVRVFLSVPSLDTPVCDEEVKRFNESTDLLGVNIYAVSMDLPFAQSRWCAAAGIGSVKTLSDYKYRQFGAATGTYIKELGLLTRAVFIVGADGKIAYVQYVPEISDHPDYTTAFAAALSAKKWAGYLS